MGKNIYIFGFCRRNQGNANLWVVLQKCSIIYMGWPIKYINAALFFFCSSVNISKFWKKKRLIILFLIYKINDSKSIVLHFNIISDSPLFAVLHTWFLFKIKVCNVAILSWFDLVQHFYLIYGETEWEKPPLEPRLLKKKNVRSAPFQIKMRLTFKQDSVIPRRISFLVSFLNHTGKFKLTFFFFPNPIDILWKRACPHGAVEQLYGDPPPEQLHHWFSGRRGGGRLFNNRNQKHRSAVRISFVCCTEWNMYVYSNSTGSDKLWNTMTV